MEHNQEDFLSSDVLLMVTRKKRREKSFLDKLLDDIIGFGEPSDRRKKRRRKG